MAGNSRAYIFRFLVALFVLIGTSAVLFFSLQGALRLRAIGFFLTAFLPLASVFVLPSAGGSARNFLLFAAAMPVVASPFLILSAMSLELGIDFFLMFWVLATACQVLALGISRFAVRLTEHTEAGIPCVIAIFFLLMAGVWIAPAFHAPALDQFWLSINPLGAVSDLFSFDWIQDGELYFSVQSERPLYYPDWRFYSAGAFAGGIVLWSVAHFLKPKSET